MANLSKTTRDHEEIRRWAEERGGKPSHVKSTESSDDIGILRIDFPGYSGEGSLGEISWDEFFEKFDAQGLALVYQEQTAEGERSNFNKLVREGAEGSAPARKAAAKKTGSKKAIKKVAPKKAVAKKAAAAKKALAKKAPAKKVVTKKAPAKKKIPAKKTVVKKAAAKKAGAKKAAKKTGRGRR